MSHEINTQLEEELADLEQEVEDTKTAMEYANKELEASNKWQVKTTNDFLQATKALSDFKQRLYNDN